MKIKDLFQLDIRRRIEGVIKAEQLDEPTVWQELSEYVVTDELEGHFRKFFDAYCNGLGGRGRSYGGSEIGVWVAGFFGSGKSHFIKVLSYLLKNETHTFENKSRTAISFFRDKFKDSILQADVKRAAEANTDVVLFNVASKADTSQKDALVRVFLRVLNELSGYSGVYPAIADMERYLDQNGLLVPFCAKFHEVAGKAWKDERDDWIFQLDQIGAAYSHVTDQKSPKFISVLESNSETYSISIEGFAKLVNQHINRKQLDRIVFLVDEVGQFIGDNGQRMLDLQTIAEELGTHCRGKAWIVITSQEDLDAVLGSVKSSRTNDFSKIQGRFRTRLSLSSANVDEVIQRRLLEKKAHIRTVLETRYDKRGDLINSLIDFEPGGMSMPKYTDATDFVRNYPILPFQFNLLQKTLDSIRKAGATGAHLSTGERSLLYAFQQAIATDDVAEGDVGLLVPFYRFYEPIAEDIETSVKAAIIQSATDPSLRHLIVKCSRCCFSFVT